MDKNFKDEPIHNEQQKLFAFVERMVDKKIAAEEEFSKEEAQVRNRNFLVAVFSLGLTFLVGAGGIIATGISENNDRDHQTMLEAKRRKLELIASVSNAITDMRELRDLNVLECNNKFTNEKRYVFEKERLRTSYELVKRVRSARPFFGETFRKIIKDFVVWNDAIENYCDKNAPSESDWVAKQEAIENEMIGADTKIFF